MRRLYLLMMVFSIPLFLSAQTKWEAGLLLGLSNYQGDLVVKSTPLFSEGNFTFGVQGKYVWNYNFTFRGGLTFAKLSGDDFNYKILERQYRGASFETSITEISIITEWEPLGSKRYQSGADFKKSISPFIFAGFAFAITNPEPDFSRSGATGFAERGNQDLNANFFESRFVIPFGLGVKVDFQEFWYVALELGMRAAFTDYLDGISLAGNPDKNDWYVIAGISIIHRIKA